jgi:hypothetical protein
MDKVQKYASTKEHFSQNYKGEVGRLQNNSLAWSRNYTIIKNSRESGENFNVDKTGLLMNASRKKLLRNKEMQ